MLLLALRRSERRLLSLSPIMLAFAALPASGLLLAPALGLSALRSGSGPMWFVCGFVVFFCGVGAYAFGRAAWAKQVGCQRTGDELAVVGQGLCAQVAAEHAALHVRTRRFGMSGRVTVYLVVLEATGLPREAYLHAGLLPWPARSAAKRIGHHLGIRVIERGAAE